MKRQRAPPNFAFSIATSRAVTGVKVSRARPSSTVEARYATGGEYHCC
jgi:hypothetical protein